MVGVGLFTIVSFIQATVKPSTVVGGDVFICCFFGTVLCGAQNCKIMMRWGSTDAGSQNRFLHFLLNSRLGDACFIPMNRATSSAAEPVARTPLCHYDSSYPRRFRWRWCGRCSCARAHHVVREHVMEAKSGQDVQPMSNASRWGLKRACMDPRTLDDWTLDTIVSACWIERIAETIVWEHWSPVRVAVCLYLYIYMSNEGKPWETWLFGLYRRVYFPLFYDL